MPFSGSPSGLSVRGKINTQTKSLATVNPREIFWAQKGDVEINQVTRCALCTQRCPGLPDACS